MRAGFRLTVFFACAAAALLVACGGGGGGSAPVGAPPTPGTTPFPASALRLLDGASAAYDVRRETTVTYVTVGIGVGGPSPAPTSTVLASTFRDTVTVAANRSFAGTPGLYDLQTRRVPTGATAATYGSYDDVVDDYEALLAGPGGSADLVSYGTHAKTAFAVTGFFSETLDDTRTNTVPLALLHLPAAGQSFDPVLAYVRTSNAMVSLPTPAPPEIFVGATSTTSSETDTLRADGSWSSNGSSQGSDGSSGSRTETVAGPGLTGTRTDSFAGYGGQKQSSTISVGAPAGSGASATIPYSITTTGTTPVTANTPLWYPGGPAQRLLARHVTDRGVSAVPASCGLGTSLPSSGEATQTVETRVDGFAGIVDVLDTTRWDAAGAGTLCAVSTETLAFYDPTTGVKADGGTSTTTQALRAFTLPSRRARASLGDAAMPLALPAAQPQLPRLIDALKRRAAAARRPASFGSSRRP